MYNITLSGPSTHDLNMGKLSANHRIVVSREGVSQQLHPELGNTYA